MLICGIESHFKGVQKLFFSSAVVPNREAESAELSNSFRHGEEHYFPPDS